MGQFTFSNEATVEVVAAPGFLLTLAPILVQVRKGDLDMVARFKVTIVREAGYIKPVYLKVEGWSMGLFKFGGASIMVPDKDYGLAGAAVSIVDLEFDMAGSTQVGLKIPFAVGGYEDPPEA